VVDQLKGKVLDENAVNDALLMIDHKVDLLYVELKTAEIGLDHIDNYVVLPQQRLLLLVRAHKFLSTVLNVIHAGNITLGLDELEEVIDAPNNKILGTFIHKHHIFEEIGVH
jgi:hypothetical protein